uniref:Uncharacterized protein n=1 Tax=Tetranychus urticae TaxID=32264 RepID=T1JYM3_TETUR
MKFIYLLCISLIIFSYVRALPFKADSLSSDEIYESSLHSDNIIYKRKSETHPILRGNTVYLSKMKPETLPYRPPEPSIFVRTWHRFLLWTEPFAIVVGFGTLGLLEKLGIKVWKEY